MSHTRIQVAAAMVLATTLIACTDDPTTRLTGSASADYGAPLSALSAGCNGVNDAQFRAKIPGGTAPVAPDGLASFGDVPQRLQQVIVYGNPIQRPYRGYGALESYGGATQTYVYDREMLDECSFGTGHTFSVVGAVEDDTLEVSDIPPDSISEQVWRSIPPRVRKQLREAAWYLAEHFIPNEMPELGNLIREARRALIFQALANAYHRAQDLRVDRRAATEAFAFSHDNRFRGMSVDETLRADALIIGCLTATGFRENLNWTGQQAAEWASRVTAGWASDATQDYRLRYLEPQLSMLGAIGAQFGREGDSCGSVARYHFENRPNDLFDPSQGGGGANPFQF